MSNDIQALLEERGKTHGEYEDHARVTQLLKLTFKQHVKGAMTLDQLETVDMIFHKLGRVAAGNAEFADHWDDIAGYATLTADRIRKRAENAKAKAATETSAANTD